MTPHTDHSSATACLSHLDGHCLNSPRFRPQHFGLLIAGLVLLPSFVAPAVAQSQSPPTVSLSVGFALMGRGEGEDLQRALEQLSFPAATLLEQPTFSPLLGRFLLVNVGLTRRLGTAVLISNATGSTFGRYQSPIGTSVTHLSSREVVTTTGFLATVRTSWISAGFGPALHFQTVRLPSDVQAQREPRSTDLGWVASVEGKFVRRDQLFASVLVHYSFAGESRLGGQAVMLVPTDTPPQSATWPVGTVSHSHLIVGIGFGVEF